jgi:hypothetical protein
MLNLVEVTVPWGKVNSDFDREDFPDMRTEDGRRVLMGDLTRNKTKLAKFHKLKIQIDEAFQYFHIEWTDWEAFKNGEIDPKGRNF